MRTAILGMTYGLIIWATNWLELYTGVDHVVDTFAVIIFHISFGFGLASAFIKDIKDY